VEVVRRAIKQYIARNPPLDVRQSALERAGTLVGSLRGAPADLASNPAYVRSYGR
jgi:hypothetical protein